MQHRGLPRLFRHIKSVVIGWIHGQAVHGKSGKIVSQRRPGFPRSSVLWTLVPPNISYETPSTERMSKSGISAANRRARRLFWAITGDLLFSGDSVSTAPPNRNNDTPLHFCEKRRLQGASGRAVVKTFGIANGWLSPQPPEFRFRGGARGVLSKPTGRSDLEIDFHRAAACHLQFDCVVEVVLI
jgi:hypothetical protein